MIIGLLIAKLEMEEVFKYGLMVQDMRGTGKTIKLTEEED